MSKRKLYKVAQRIAFARWLTANGSVIHETSVAVTLGVQSAPL